MIIPKACQVERVLHVLLSKLFIIIYFNFVVRYNAACFACSLEQDLKILPSGDQTEVNKNTIISIFLAFFTVYCFSVS